MDCLRVTDFIPKPKFPPKWNPLCKKNIPYQTKAVAVSPV